MTSEIDDPYAFRYDRMLASRDQYKAEAHLLTRERDDAVAELGRVRLNLRQALVQIEEFRRECDPREDKVLVSHIEMLGDAAWMPLAQVIDAEGNDVSEYYAGGLTGAEREK